MTTTPAGNGSRPSLPLRWALEPWHLLVLMILLVPVLAVVLVVVLLVNRRRSSPPPWGAMPPASPPSAPIFTDQATGRRYTIDPVSGRSVWLDVPPPPQ